MEVEAQQFYDRGDFQQAEQIYRQVLDRELREQGAEAAVRTKYNLGVTLVDQQKFEEAETFLEDVVTALTERPVGREAKNFLLQEAGALRLLGRALQAMGKESDARQKYDEAEKREEEASSASC